MFIRTSVMGIMAAGLCGLCLISMTAALAAEDKDKIVFCKKLAEAHKPADDVRYKPGMDVHGKPVVPADLGAPLNMAPSLYPVRIPLVLDVIERFGLNTPDGLMGESQIAEIMVYQDGRTTYNGRDISASIQSYCLDDKPEPPPVQTGSPSAAKPVPAPLYDGEGLDGQYH